VAVTFGKIEEDFSELSGFVLNDLKIIMAAPKGGNYAAVLLVVTACEAVGMLRYGKKDGGSEFFRNYLTPNKWKSVANSVYDALRNGLAHSFATKSILRISDTQIEICVSWSKERHFNYDARRKMLFINIQALSQDLCQAFEKYKAELRNNAELRDKYIVWRRKERVVEIQNEEEKQSWKALVKQNGG
jgi:hypothetical protein